MTNQHGFGRFDARAFAGQWSLDAKLALRMLIRFPGLTIVSVLGMAVAIAIAVGAFIGGTVLFAPLPLHEGDRIVSVQSWDALKNTHERRVLHDFAAWRDQATTLEDVAVFRQVSRTLLAPGLPPAIVRVAEISAAGFRVARVAPHLGRPLIDADEQTGAAPVVVVGYDEWRARFSADPEVIGRTIQLGAIARTIVGVMPDGFAFPVNHQFWVPLSLNQSGGEPRSGAEVFAFARLAPGATLEMAQAEMAAVGQRLAAASPATHEHLRTQVVPYTHTFTDMDEPENALGLRLMQFLVVMLLGIVCVNVAILVYARTATRRAELSVRSALGASRRRIVAQLFIEALALTMVAAVLGVGMVAIALRVVDAALLEIAGQLPFWMNFALTPAALLCALVLAVGAAAIVGVIPALKATGRDVHAELKELAAGGGAGMRLGRAWTGLVVAQVAVAVALLPATAYHAWDTTRPAVSGLGFAAHEFLNAQLLMDDEALTMRFADRQVDFMRRVAGSPDVAAVTFAMQVPDAEPRAWIDVDGLARPLQADDYNVAAGSAAGHAVHLNRIAPDWLTVFDVPLLAGRAVDNGDTAAGSAAVVVNRAFVETILEGGNPLGRRIRYVGVSADGRTANVDLERWYEIVGVVADFPARATTSTAALAKVYHAAAPGQLHPVNITVRVRGNPAAVAGTLLRTSAGVDPHLQVRNVSRLDDLMLQEQSLFRLIAGALVLLTLSVMVLSAAGIYALMSCTVERRRREIGIRMALGADRRQLLAAIFGRAARQLGLGALLGIAAAALLDAASGGDLMAGHQRVVLPVVAVVMMIVGLIAAWSPARRGLRIHPTEALRAE